MANHYELTGKTVLITGAAGQIGQQLVAAFLANGAIVHGVDLKPEMAPLKECTDRFHYHVADITKESSISEAISSIGSIDVLVNCAGMGVYTPFESRTEDELDTVIALNLKATILMSKVVAEVMKGKKSGSIINFGSIYGVTTPDFRIYGDSGRNSSEIYGATKAGVIHFTKYLAAYLAPYGIRANSISPGGVFNEQDPSFVEKYEYKTPLARMAQVDDLVGTILFLATDDARYITGQNIAVDGGFTVW